MPRGESAKPVQIHMDGQDKATVALLAEAAGFKSVSAYIRNLIENDARYRHIELKFEVRDMGYRSDLRHDEPQPAA